MLRLLLSGWLPVKCSSQSLLCLYEFSRLRRLLLSLALAQHESHNPCCACLLCLGSGFCRRAASPLSLRLSLGLQFEQVNATVERAEQERIQVHTSNKALARKVNPLLSLTLIESELIGVCCLFTFAVGLCSLLYGACNAQLSIVRC